MAVNPHQYQNPAAVVKTAVTTRIKTFEEDYLTPHASSMWEAVLLGSVALTFLALVPAWMGVMDVAFLVGGIGMGGSLIGFTGDLVTMRDREGLEENFIGTSGINYAGALILLVHTMHPAFLVMGAGMVGIATLCYHGCSRGWIEPYQLG